MALTIDPKKLQLIGVVLAIQAPILLVNFYRRDYGRNYCLANLWPDCAYNWLYITIASVALSWIIYFFLRPILLSYPSEKVNRFTIREYLPFSFFILFASLLIEKGIRDLIHILPLSAVIVRERQEWFMENQVFYFYENTKIIHTGLIYMSFQLMLLNHSIISRKKYLEQTI